MNSKKRLIGSLVAFGGVASGLLAGCEFEDDERCGPGLELREDELCYAPKPDAGAVAEGGEAGDGGEGGEAGEAAAPTFFGKSCATMSECGGDAPVCAAPMLPYCTQVNCAAGEANAGQCPAGWVCISTPGQPSGCLRQ